MTDQIHVAAAVIRNNANQVFISLRPDHVHQGGLWEFPGGKVEAGESRWQALQRELKEEVGIHASHGEPFIEVYYRYPERNVLLDVWMVERFSGEVSSREQQALRWIDRAQIDDYRYPPADLPVIEAIKNSEKAGTRRLP